jgi:hypothetical protein
VRIGMFFVAAGFLLLSMAMDRRAWAIPAIVIAIAALLMRFLPGEEGPDAPYPSDEMDVEDEEEDRAGRTS